MASKKHTKKEVENKEQPQSEITKEKVIKEEEKEKNKEENENKKDDDTKKTTQDSKEITKKNVKKYYKLIIISSIFLVFFFLISVIFAVITVNTTTYISGITIKGINISGMEINQAKEKIEEIIEKELKSTINLKYKNQTLVAIKPEEIDFSYELNKNLKEAYEIGRNGNIFKNNYEIIFTAISKKDFKLTYTYNQEKLEEIINNLEPNIPNLVKNPSYYIDGKELVIVSGTDGVVVEKEKLEELIFEKITQTDLNNNENNEIILDIEIPVANKEAEKIDLQKIYEEVYSEPKDAYFIEEPFELHLDEDGIDFDVSMEEAKNIISTEAEEYVIPLKITKAKITINDIDSSAFRYEVSKFSTNYDPGYTSRVNNLKLATNKINGKVLRPGEEFSFNEVVGKRTIEAGYTDAKIFLNGEVVDGTGGGICQVSTTLYNAVLLANLEVTSRRNHNYTTSYVKAGRDATVVYGAIDFKFKNTRKYPIKLEGKVSGGVIQFKIYGVEEENEYDIKIIPVVTSTIPKTTKYVDDATLVEGSEVVKQVGTSGCKVTTYKETYLKGALISKEVISNDTYKAMARIVKKGTKKASVPTVSQPAENNTPPAAEEPILQPETPEPEQSEPSVPETQQQTQATPSVPVIQDTI